MAPKTKATSIDAAIKSLLRDYGIITRKDMEKLQTKVTRLEKTIKELSVKQTTTSPRPRPSRGAGSRRLSATNVVLEAIKRSKKGVNFASLQRKTGFDEKKLRNIIFRLHKLGKIKRVSRGVYTAV